MWHQQLGLMSTGARLRMTTTMLKGCSIENLEEWITNQEYRGDDVDITY